MKAQHYLLILSIALSSNIKTSAQTSAVRPLAVGDTLPKLLLKGFLDKPDRQVPASALYQQKLLLIDLSATWCVPCVKAWPVLDSLKKVFMGRLEILRVTNEPAKQVRAFMDAHPEQAQLKLDFITDNRQNNEWLAKAFPYRMVPELIWVNSKGKIISITDGEKVTGDNIRNAMQSDRLDVKQKKDQLNFSWDTYRLDDEHPALRAVLTGRRDGIFASSTYHPLQNVDDVRLIDKLLMTNLDVKFLYLEAVYHHTISIYNQERLIFDVPDSVRARLDYSFYKKSYPQLYASDDAWKSANSHCYELETNSPRPATQLREIMIRDLNAGLNLNGHFETRELPCWVLSKYGQAGKLLKTKKAEESIEYKAGTATVFAKQPFEKVVYFLNKYLIAGQIVDETGIKGMVDIDLTGIKGELTTPELFNTVLKKFDLRLTKKIRPVQVFIITQQH